MVDGCLCEHLKANVEMIDLSSGVERELSVETKRRMSMKKEFLRPFRAFRASSGGLLMLKDAMRSIATLTAVTYQRHPSIVL